MRGVLGFEKDPVSRFGYQSVPAEYELAMVLPAQEADWRGGSAMVN